LVKDNRTLSRIEREMEREREQHEREERRRSPSHGRPSAARAVQRIKGMSRAMGKGGAGKSGGPKSPSNRIPFAPSARQAPLREFSRRAFVRARFVASKKMGQWSAHARYLAREGAQSEGLTGVGFDQHSDAVNMTATADQWQRDGDNRLYKLVLSPEDGLQLDLPTYTRRFMADLEKQAGKPLEWMAIDHHNTDNPHVHVMLRGRGLDLAPDLVRSGLRTIAEDQATQMLGYKSEAEKRRELDKDITARRFTQLDRLIQAKAQTQVESGVQIVSEASLTRIQRMSGSPTRQREEELRTKRIARLQNLETLGVAEKVGAMTWRLDDNWQSALKQLEIMRTRSTMLIQHRELMTDPRCLPQVTKLQPGESLVGRSLGGGIDEATDRRYLLVEGADGRAHFVDRSDVADSVQPGKLVRLEGYSSRSGQPGIAVREYDLVIPASGYARAMQDSPAVEQAARDEVAARARAGRAIQEQATASAGFAAHMQRAIVAAQEKQRRERERQRGQAGAERLIDIGRSQT
jgi:type IV secretory pathway VirD2 relaxase